MSEMGRFQHLRCYNSELVLAHGGFSLAEGRKGAVWQSTADYSQRNDFMGSVRTARRAGIKLAAIAASIRAEATLA